MKRKYLWKWLILLPMAAIWCYPLFVAFKESLAINGLGNYEAVLNHPRISYPRVLFNSVFISIVSTAIVVVISSLAAYGFSKFQFKGKKLLYYLLVACLTLPPAAIMVPLVFFGKTFKLNNTYTSMILIMASFHAPYMMVTMRNYFSTIPDALLEAAVIDGASPMQIYRRVMLPLGLPAILNVCLLSFIYCWNNYLIPLIFVTKEPMYTITLATTYLTDSGNMTMEMQAQLYAYLILAILPSVLLYMFLNRYFRSDMTSGAVK
ncbi:carbohydrate ABC transporter permease [Lacrimispora indolis]|uniref:carbohydrate ABC transporter permease n=1 Tax=Lacrimispora indolis TaxID=69825 RepID=UPI0004062ACD|nr:MULTISPECIES: carbohydrate ABC transporter permease [Lachnospiraceae]MBE7717946.1 carbohydrate ABC transporter permease [Lacrimispora celerecrescens]